MKKRILLKMMLTVGVAGVACGYDSKSKEVVDYNVGTEEEGSLTGTTGKESEVAQFKDAEPMQYACKTKDGIDITVDARVVVPEYETMSVVEVERTIYTPKEKERITKAFFGDGAIYVYDAQNGEIKNEVTRDYSENAFWGSRDGIDFVIDFIHKEYDIDGQIEEADFNEHAFVIYPMNQNEVMPREIASLEVAEAYEAIGVPNKNKCKYTKEQAQEIADGILGELGLEEYDMVEFSNIDWNAGKMVGENVIMEITDEDQNGYVFHYAIQIDKTNGVYAPDLYNYVQNTIISTKEEQRNYYFNDAPCLSIAVSEQGFMYMEAAMLFEIKRVTSQVNMLPLSTIEEIMEDEMAGFDKSFVKSFTMYEPASIDFNNTLKLNYDKQKQDNSDKFFYVPIWELSRLVEDGLRIRVNAIDGTVLDYE